MGLPSGFRALETCLPYKSNPGPYYPVVFKRLYCYRLRHTSLSTSFNYRKSYRYRILRLLYCVVTALCRYCLVPLLHCTATALYRYCIVPLLHCTVSVLSRYCIEQ